MKISIGTKVVEGPFGGGNNFLKNLIIFLKDQGHDVIDHLRDDDIDIILLTNPLIDSETSTYNNFDINFYTKFKNPKAITFQRINECDERKGTTGINTKLSKFNKFIDINIFVSSWLKDNFRNFSLYSKESYIIKGGPSEKIFNTIDKKFWDKKQRLKIVTHHWSSNYMKGYGVYKSLDELLEKDNMKKQYEFTFIGNLPKDIQFSNSRVLKPLHGLSLAQELKSHDVYLTASLNEPSGNHHMEGAMCGLPILYIKSGALPEYCGKYGIEFNNKNLENSLQEMSKNYSKFKDRLNSYPYSFNYAAKQYIDLFDDAIKRKNELIKKRPRMNSFQVILGYIINRFSRRLYKLKVVIKKTLGSIKRLLFK